MVRENGRRTTKQPRPGGEKNAVVQHGTRAQRTLGRTEKIQYGVTDQLRTIDKLTNSVTNSADGRGNGNALQGEKRAKEITWTIQQRIPPFIRGCRTLAAIPVPL